MKAMRGYVPALLMLSAIAANHLVVWHGRDAIVKYSSLLGILMLVAMIGCVAVIVGALRHRGGPGSTSQLIVSLVALLVLVFDIVIPYIRNV
jgi:hypothetical protein